MFKEYVDCEIELQPKRGASFPFFVRSSGGEAAGKLRLPTNDPAYQQLMSRLAALDTDEAILVQIGQILFKALFQGQVKEVYRHSQRMLQNNQGLRIKLNFAASENEVAGLPWEFMYDPERGPLALLGIAIVRYLPSSMNSTALPTASPLKILLTSAAINPLINSEYEFNEVRAALAQIEPAGSVIIQPEPHLTRALLQQRLREGFHIWHFVGHCGLSRDQRSYQLLLEDGAGDPDAINTRELSFLLNRSGLRLVVLSACDTATPTNEPTGSMASALVRAQVPTVIAMQLRIPQDATRAFAGEFYRTLAAGFPIDACVTEGRKAIVGMTGLRNPDWGLPVVYTHASDTKLFDLPATKMPNAPAQPEHGNGINISIGSGQQVHKGASINVSGIGNTMIGAGEQEKESAMPPTTDDSLDEIGPLRQEIKMKKRRLQERRLQAARSGSMTDPSITIEIEDLQKDITKLERQLQELERAAPIPANSETPSSQGGQPNGGSTPRNTPLPPLPTVPQAIPFTLRIADQGDHADIIWETHVIGSRRSSFHLPFDSATLPVVIKALDAIQYGREFAAERLNETDRAQLAVLGLWAGDKLVADIHKRVGRAIYAALVADPEGNIALRTARDYATAEGKPLSYLFRFPPDAINLAALPWELLWDQAGPLLLSRGKLASWVRYLDLDQALPPAIALDSNRPLRILAVAPHAEMPVGIRTNERLAREQAWAGLVAAGNVVIEELSSTTRSGLIDRIQTGPQVDILHFYGHGRYRDGEGALLFDKADGGMTWVSADQLATLFSDVRLVMLHACKSAMVSDKGLLSAVAPALSAAGIPAVVAMQLTVQAEAGTRFAGVVYRNLARGASVQDAVNQARQALFVEDDEGISWYVPTLTIRARNTGPLRLVQV